MYSVKSVRKRLLECLDRHTLERLSHWEDAPRRSRDTIIKYILVNVVWSTEHDKAIQVIVDQAKSIHERA